MAAILHCIVTEIENARMREQLHVWREKMGIDLIREIRRLRENSSALTTRVETLTRVSWEALAITHIESDPELQESLGVNEDDVAEESETVFKTLAYVLPWSHTSRVEGRLSRRGRERKDALKTARRAARRAAKKAVKEAKKAAKKALKKAVKEAVRNGTLTAFLTTCTLPKLKHIAFLYKVKPLGDARRRDTFVTALEVGLSDLTSTR